MKSGIYIISSLRFKDRVYVGSAVHIPARQKRHFSDLARNQHHNQILQNHYNKYGAADLVFRVMVLCPVSSLIKEEQFWIDLLNPYFNICQTAGSRLGVRLSDQVKIKMQRSFKLRPPIPQLWRYAKLLGTKKPAG